MKKKHSPEDKMLILKQHLQDGKSIADLSKEHGIHPNQIYKWKKELFEGGAAIFSGKHKKPKAASQTEKYEEELRKKDGIISWLAEENLKLKKSILATERLGTTRNAGKSPASFLVCLAI